MTRHGRFALRLLACWVTLPGLTGCSFLFVKAPPSNVSGLAPPGNCTSSKLAPIADTVFGSLEVLRTAVAASADEKVYAKPDAPLSQKADVGLGLAFAVLFLSSAGYGFYRTSECSDRKARHYRHEVPDSNDDVAPEAADSEPPEVDEPFKPEHSSSAPGRAAAPAENGPPVAPSAMSPAPSAAPSAEPAPVPPEDVTLDEDVPDGGSEP